MQRNSASYRSVTESLTSNIIWFIIQIFLQTQAHPWGPVSTVCGDPVSPGAFLQRAVCPPPLLSSALACKAPLLVTAELLFRAVVLEPIIPNQSESEPLSRPELLCVPKAVHPTVLNCTPFVALRCVHEPPMCCLFVNTDRN